MKASTGPKQSNGTGGASAPPVLRVCDVARWARSRTAWVRHRAHCWHGWGPHRCLSLSTVGAIRWITAGSRSTARLRAVARPVRFEHYRYVGDKRSLVVYDLDLYGVDDEVTA